MDSISVNFIRSARLGLAKFANSMRDSIQDVTASQQKFLHLIALLEFPSSSSVFLLDRVTFHSVNLLFAGRGIRATRLLPLLECVTLR